MSFNISVNVPGRIVSPKGEPLFALGYGSTAITPRNASLIFSQMKSDLAFNVGPLAGKRQHKPLTITKQFGAASPQLFNAHWTSEILQTVVIQITGPNSGQGGEQVYQRITLTNARIGRYTRYMAPFQPKEGGGRQSHPGSSELEEFELTFQKITYENVGKSTSASDDWTG